jgi:hypothetical protein
MLLLDVQMFSILMKSNSFFLLLPRLLVSYQEIIAKCNIMKLFSYISFLEFYILAPDIALWSTLSFWFLGFFFFFCIQCNVRISRVSFACGQ